VAAEAFHYSVLKAFSEDYYNGLLTPANLKEEIAIGKGEEARMYWLLEKGKKKYILDSELFDQLPLKIVETTPIAHYGKVFHHLTRVQSVKFRAEQRLSFRELVDTFAPFKHDNPLHFLLYKIIALVAYVSRINVRVSTNPGFGKDSIFSILHHLRGDSPTFNPNSMAAIDYRLNSSVIVLTEISHITSEQRKLLQEFLLVAGDMKNIYEKPTRGTSKYGTQDTYDISRLSIVINYNTLQDYEKAGQGKNFFDYIYQPAVLDRFCPFKLSGRLDVGQFLTVERPRELYRKYTELYRDILYSIEYYRREFDDMDVDAPLPQSMRPRGRHLASFLRIAKGIALYAEDEDEYDTLLDELWKSYRGYLKMVGERVDTLDSFTTPVPRKKIKKKKRVAPPPVDEEFVGEFPIPPPEAMKWLEEHKDYPLELKVKLFCEHFNVGEEIAHKYI